MIKILYAEDHELTRMNYTEYLRSCGYFVKSVEDGDAASELYKKESWDLLLLDMEMPCKTGEEILLELRANGDRVPIIVLSSWDCCELLLKGANDFVDKGEPVERLKIRIENILMRAREMDMNIIRLNRQVEYNKISRVLTIGKDSVRLKPTLGKIFLHLCLRKNEQLTEEQLCLHVWNVYSREKCSELSSYISAIRKLCGKMNGIRVEKEYGGAYIFLVEG